MNHPRFWERYVGNTSVKQRKEDKNNFLQHINSTDQAFTLTVEDAWQDGLMCFLDTIIMPQLNRVFFISVYRKPKHTNEYLQLDRHCPIAAKYGATRAAQNRTVIFKRGPFQMQTPCMYFG